MRAGPGIAADVACGAATLYFVVACRATQSMSSIHQAAQSLDYESLSRLLQSDTDVNPNEFSEDGSTPLQEIIYAGGDPERQLQCAKLLLQHGASPDLCLEGWISLS